MRSKTLSVLFATLTFLSHATAQTPTVTGTIRDAGGQPVTDARLTMRIGPDEPQSIPTHDGSFELVPPPSSPFSLEVRSACCTRQVHEFSEPPIDPFDVTLQAQSRRPSDSNPLLLHGTVHEAGEPVQGAIVEADSPYENVSQIMRTTTDGHGWYFLEVNKGPAQVVVRHANFHDAITTREFTEDTRLDVPMRQGHTTLAGLILTAAGRHVQNSTVRIDRLAGCVLPYCSETNEPAYLEENWTYVRGPANAAGYLLRLEDGRWTANLSPGTFHVALWADNETADITLTLAAGTRVFVAHRQDGAPSHATYAILAQDAAGRPIPNAQIYYLHPATGQTGQALTSEAGRVAVDAASGRLLVRIDGGQSFSTFLGFVSNREEANVTLDPASPSTGQNGRRVEVAGYAVAREEMALRNASIRFVNVESGQWGQTLTDADGSYRIYLDPGKYAVFGLAGRHQHASVLETNASGSCDLVFEAAFAWDRLDEWTLFAAREEGSGESFPGAPLVGGPSNPIPQHAWDALGVPTHTQSYPGFPGGLGPRPSPEASEPKHGSAPGMTAAILVVALGILAIRQSIRRRR